MEAGIGVMQLRAKEHLEPPRAGRGKEVFFPRTLGGSAAHGLQALREFISVVLTHQVCSFVMAATGNSVIKHSIPRGYLLKSTFINYQAWFS